MSDRATAVVLREPKRIEVQEVALTPPAAGDVVVDVAWSGVSAGTERLLWSGEMPVFPGMGYPLVPGYEAVGLVVEAGPEARVAVGEHVFTPGARCFDPIKGLFGGAASRLVTPSERVAVIDPALRDKGVLLALAATARHALAGYASKARYASADHRPAGAAPLIIGHGVLGRLLARLAPLLGLGAPMVVESDPQRRGGAVDYEVVAPKSCPNNAFDLIVDASGDASIIDTLVQRLKPSGEIVLAGFYRDRVSFAFPPAFMKEARFRIAAEWRREDLNAVIRLVENGELCLEGLTTHAAPAAAARSAYRTAFEDPSCLKMILDWRGSA